MTAAPAPAADLLDPIVAADIPPARRIRLVDLEDCGCRWPFGDPRDRDFGFCDRTSIDGGPYCPPHAALAFEVRGTRK